MTFLGGGRRFGRGVRRSPVDPSREEGKKIRLFAGHPIVRYVFKRMIQAIPLLFWVIVVNFLLVHLAPGDPVSFLAGEYEATPDFIAAMRREFGLNKPLLTQLGVYLLKVLHGDLGYSMRFRQPVLDLIASRVPATFLLMGSGLLISVVLGLFLGVAYTRRSEVSENLSLTFAIAGHSIPAFWLGQILLIVFSLQFGLFPVQGMTSIRTVHSGLSAVFDVLRHLTLPALTYATYHLTLVFRLTRSKMLEVLSQDFIITARGKGLDRRTILHRHVLPNVLIPIVTVLGVNMGFMLSGSVLVETVFGWPGMGRLFFEAVMARDYPLLLGLFIVTCTMVIVANLLADIVYALIDPRVAYE